MSLFHNIIQLEEIDSTNNYLKQLAREQSLSDGTVVVSEFQTGGRGQQGNTWFSTKGDNLLFSLLVRPKKVAANEMFYISCITSLALVNTLSPLIDNVRIKWSNDIYWNDKKLAGILIENTFQENLIQQSVIGIGLNVNEATFSANLPNPVSLYQITKQKLDKEHLLRSFLLKFSSLYVSFERNELPHLMDDYKRNLYRADGYYWYEDQNEKFEATINNVLPSGHIELRTKANEVRKYAFKEVVFLSSPT